MDEHQGSTPCIPVWKTGVYLSTLMLEWSPVQDLHLTLRFCKPPPALLGQRDILKLIERAPPAILRLPVESSYYAQWHTSAEMESIFASTFGSRIAFCGFERISPRRWVRETNKGFKYLFQLATGNSGFSYAPCGAISLDFVPRIVAGRVKVQPKAKHAAVHVSFKHSNWWSIDKRREGLREKIDTIAAEAVPQITSWFESLRSLSDILSEIELRRSKSMNLDYDFYCYPVLALSYAFLLARLGRDDEAKREFVRALKSGYFDSDLHDDLRNHFASELQYSK